jgi:hypothetical protein
LNFKIRFSYPNVASYPGKFLYLAEIANMKLRAAARSVTRRSSRVGGGADAASATAGWIGKAKPVANSRNRRQKLEKPGLTAKRRSMQSSMTAWLKQYFSHRPLSVKRALLIIILLAAIPPIIFSAVVLIRYAASERIIAERTLVESAEAVARAIDAEFMAVEAVLQALASSTRLQADDLQGFGDQLRAVSARTGMDFSLVDPQGQTIIATSPEMSLEIFRSPEETVFTNVLPKLEGAFAAYVIIPFKRKNGDVWFLEGSVKNADFRDVLAEPGVPSDWVVSIADRTGTHLIRSHGNERFVGKPLVDPLVAQIKRRQRGIQETVSLEGIPLISTVAFARTSGWAAAIGLPRANLAAPLREQLTSLVLLAVPLTALALIAGVMLAGLLNGAMDALKIMAGQVGRDGDTAFAPTLIRDANEVGDVMAQTSAELHRRREELAALNATLEERVMARTAELTEANKRLENEIRLRETSIVNVKIAIKSKMESHPEVTLEYFEIADSENLTLLNSVDESNKPILCIAAYVGEVRLIDNMFYN